MALPHAVTGRLIAAIGLPQTPAGVVLTLVLLLTVTYALLTIFIRVSVPSGEPDEEPPRTDGPPDAAYANENAPPDEELFARPGGGTDTSSSEPPATDDPIEPPREALAIERLRVGSQYVSLGDTSSRVMLVFRTLTGETTPMIQRDSAGEAISVCRSYRIGRRTVTLVLERERPEDPLRLARIDMTS